MLKKIIDLFKSNLLSVVLNTVIILLTAKLLGAEGRGEITIITSLSLILQLFNGVIGSGAVYYILKRFDVSELWLVSIVWFITMSFISSFLCFSLNLLNKEYYFILFFYTFLSSGLALQYLLHIHLNQINVYSLLKISQPIIALILILLTKDILDVYSYFCINICSIFLCICASIICLKLNFKRLDWLRLKSLFSDSIKYGGTSQLSNLTQIVNYRYSFFLLESYVGIAAVGIFSIVFTICEFIWLFCSTVSTVVCSEISKYNDSVKEVLETKRAYKLVFTITSLIILSILIIPTDLYVFLLNEEFVKVKQVLFYIVPGVLIFSVAKVISHYFSALGLMKYNLFSSVISMLILIPTGLFLVPEYGLNGAAITNCISYLITAMFLFYFFKKRNNTSLL